MTWTDFLIVGGVIVGVLALRHWVFPRLGLPT